MTGNLYSLDFSSKLFELISGGNKLLSVEIPNDPLAFVLIFSFSGNHRIHSETP